MGIPVQKRASARNESAGGSTEPHPRPSLAARFHAIGNKMPVTSVYLLEINASSAVFCCGFRVEDV